MNWRFFAFGPPGLLLAVLGGPVEPDRECAQFGAKPLRAGSAFVHPLPAGLEFRLPFDGRSWSISVGPRGDPEADFLAPVSPPFRSAPHLIIGSGYGVTALESVGVSRRELRFVLSRHDAQAARDIASAARVGDLQRLKELDRLARGTLTLRITDADADDEVIRWVEFEGEACIPI